VRGHDTLVSHNGTCCIGINTDAAAVTDAALLRACITDGFDEVLRLVPS
jgi:diacylglycerol O-acyltransferase